jgi:pSer/pThr/pTyr-binding forkhead associated (FHA) protein
MASASLILPGGGEYRLPSEVSIGRDEGNGLVLANKSVSRRHAQIKETGGRWFIEDYGSFNGTVVNDDRIRPGILLPLRHSDRIQIGPYVFVFAAPPGYDDREQTEAFEAATPTYERQLSPLQQRVVHLLCEPWLTSGSLEHLPSNEEIAAALGTPGATETVKAALRRAYAKAGLSNLPPHEKRRALCRVARQRDWI